MKKILLKPYPGYLLFTHNRREFLEEFKKFMEHDWPHGYAEGTTVNLSRFGHENVYLVHARRNKDRSTAAHELGHVILLLFKDIGCDPSEGGGEPFCYMLSHLMSETR